MALRIRRTTGVFLAAVGLAIATSAVTAGAASAATSISEVPCNSPDYVHVIYHIENEPVRSDHACFANAGTFNVTCCNPNLPTDECFKIQ